MQKMMLKYPKFINQSLNRYSYLIKRTNFANEKDNIEPVLEINGDLPVDCSNVSWERCHDITSACTPLNRQRARSAT